ncbi:C25 family cysteine peptidase, partial [candidate division KSB1 bacterium]|nr:C25 family cysteine peptidase [candidate division KSB1 bacterium]
GDAIYGEVADNIDMLPEVILGRAPVEDANEADTFVKKVIQYEKNPPIGYQRDILFAAEILWADPYTDTGIAKDMIEASYFPPGFYNVTKLYQDQGNESVASVRDAMNRGQHIINHHGHASTNVMGMGDGYFHKTDMSALANRSRQSILYSIGCYPANFEADCIAEAFLNNPSGGGVAFIGNSRYGWGSPGNPGYGYSDRFDDQFFKFLFAEKKFSLGLALALAKATYIPFSQEENVYRWCMYEITLLGDPEMPIWTDIPDTLFVQYPTAITSNEAVIPITITAHGAPLAKALVCLLQEDKIYQSARTDAAGQARFAIASASPATPISLTVTAPNFLPLERTIEVKADGPFLVCTGYSIDDDQGNSDGLLNPFESVRLKIRLHNFGSQPAMGMGARITSKNDSLSVIKNEIQMGDIAANDSIESVESFELALPFDSRNGLTYFCDLKLVAASGDEWDQLISLVCATPVLAVNRVDFADEPNRNGILEPGETITIIPTFVNQGKSVASDVKVFFTTDDPNLRIGQEIKAIGNINPGESVSDTFIVTIPENYSTLPSFPKFELSFTTADGYFFQTQFDAAIGNTGFSDNFENGGANWQLPGSSDNQWHITQKDFHSGARSFYCGDEQSGTYRKNNESIIESPAFYLGQNAQLSFWAKYNVAIYGVNGFYVRLFDGNEWHKLDFIGSGGALDSTLMGNDWLPYSYDLSGFAAGTSAKIQFHWVSDNEPLPAGVSGVFLDDVMVQSVVTVIQNNIAGERTLPEKHQLDQNYPNPFNSSTTINFKIAENSYQQIELSIYNLSGQKVKSLVDRSAGPGYYIMIWDGRNDSGNQVASGVYLYQLHVGKIYLKKKLLLIR